METNTKAEILSYLIVALFISFCTSLSIGFIDGYVDQKCVYPSIISRINIPYVIGCELTKPRFK